MNNSWNDELISAYLDGELTADEQAQVEQALATDARLRQMHDDLRAQRQLLQTLPHRKLDAAFAARVMQAAQQAKTKDSTATPLASTVAVAIETHSPPAHDPHHHLAVVPAHPKEPTAWHVMVWGVAGSAAALLLVLLWPGPMGEMARRDMAPQPQVAMQSDQPDADEAANSLKSLERAEPMMKESAMKAVQEEQSAGPAAVEKADAQRNELQGAARFGIPNDAPESAQNRPLADGAVPPPPAAPVVTPEAAKALPAPAPRMAMSADAEGGAPRRFSRGEMPGGAGKKLLTQRSLAEGPETEQLVVVRLRVPAEALKRGDIDTTLSKHGIAMASELAEKKRASAVNPERSEAQPAEQEKVQADAAASAALPIEAKPTEDRLALGALERLSTDDVDRFMKEGVGGVELLYVEASPEQIAQTLDDLKSQSGVIVDLAQSTKAENAGANASFSDRPNAVRRGSLKPENAGDLPTPLSEPPPPGANIVPLDAAGLGRGSGGNTASAPASAAPLTADKTGEPRKSGIAAAGNAAPTEKPAAKGMSNKKADTRDQDSVEAESRSFASRVPLDRFRQQGAGQQRTDGTLPKQANNVADPVAAAQMAVQDAAQADRKDAAREANPRRVRVLLVIEAQE